MTKRRPRKTRELKDIRTRPVEVRTPGGGHDDSKTRWAKSKGEPSVPDDATIETNPDLFWRGLSPGDLERVEREAPGGFDGQGRPRFWPRTRPAYPCPRCGRVLTKGRHQAIKCYGHHEDKAGKEYAYLECRLCAHRFTLERAPA